MNEDPVGMSGLASIVSGFACNCNFSRVLFSTCDNFGNRYMLNVWFRLRKCSKYTKTLTVRKTVYFLLLPNNRAESYKVIIIVIADFAQLMDIQKISPNTNMTNKINTMILTTVRKTKSLFSRP